MFQNRRLAYQVQGSTPALTLLLSQLYLRPITLHAVLPLPEVDVKTTVSSVAQCEPPAECTVTLDMFAESDRLWFVWHQDTLPNVSVPSTLKWTALGRFAFVLAACAPITCR